MNTLLIQSNYELALNNIPELLFAPDMIYVNGKFNNKPIILFIDTGARTSVMSLDKVKELGLFDYIDYECNGLAVGIGKQEIIGRIHYFEIEIDNFIIPISVDVLNNMPNGFDILIGLNVLYANGIGIDVKNKNLFFGNNKIKYN